MKIGRLDKARIESASHFAVELPESHFNKAVKSFAILRYGLLAETPKLSSLILDSEVEKVGDARFDIVLVAVGSLLNPRRDGSLISSLSSSNDSFVTNALLFYVCLELMVLANKLLT